MCVCVCVCVCVRACRCVCVCVKTGYSLLQCVRNTESFAAFKRDSQRVFSKAPEVAAWASFSV